MSRVLLWMPALGALLGLGCASPTGRRTRSHHRRRDSALHLLWEGTEFAEHDVEADAEALARMFALTGGRRNVPVLVEDGRVKEIGWQGRSCLV